jgi:hypothetical protein
MQRGTRAALAVAMAGLLAAGAASVTLAQTEQPAPPAGATHFFLLVPVTPSAAPDATGPNPDGSPVVPGEDPAGDATPDTGATQERSFILIPLPQGDASTLQGDDDSATGDDAAPGGDSDATPAPGDDGTDGTEGPTPILVPRPAPHGLPDGILEA